MLNGWVIKNPNGLELGFFLNYSIADKFCELFELKKEWIISCNLEYTVNNIHI